MQPQGAGLYDRNQVEQKKKEHGRKRLAAGAQRMSNMHARTRNLPGNGCFAGCRYARCFSLRIQ